MSKEEQDTFTEKFKDILFNPRILVLLFFLLISFVAISWNFGEEGVVINGVTPNSPATQAGMSFDKKTSLTNLEEIEMINGQTISNVSHYYSYLSTVSPNETLSIETDKDSYTINLPSSFNGSVSEVVGISVREEPNSNIALGIELEGGSRLILNPLSNLTDSEFELLAETLQNRLDIYGASGTKVNTIEDSFSNERFIVVESISSNKNDIYELISREGLFEAKIANETVFTGDNVVHVYNDPQHANLQGCSNSAGGGQICTFGFSVQIDNAGADAFFNKTSSLTVEGDQLSEEVSFYLDGEQITSLTIASSFKYDRVTQPQITVSGDSYPTREEAVESAQQEMKFLQTILSTQSLPTELEVEQSYSISSSRGEQLLKNATLVGLFAVLLVASVIALRFRKPILFFGILVALISELIVVFGAAAFMKISIDLAAIGGLIAAIGTGVDDQIIITDEYFRKKNNKLTSRRKVKHAMAIILIAYLTTLVAMAPFIFSASLSLVKGFAFMIIVGVTVGVLITRPAYAAYLRVMMTTREQREEEAEEEEK